VTIAPGRKALVTGGASGFGLDVATRLAREGASVALLDVSRDRLEAAAQSLGAVAIEADVRSPRAVADAVEHAQSQLGGLDTLVLSAGVIHVKPVEQVTEDDWDRTLDINLKGSFLVAQAAAPALRASGRGRIVAISSDAGRRGSPWIAAYCASKFGLIGLVESLAAELAADQVTVNAVCPVGCPTTSMGDQLVDWKSARMSASREEIVASTARINPLGRNATEADVSEAILYFVSDEASFLTGVSLDVDGGLHLGIIPGAD
jgi:meso-butanediol dehydrogenase / (S,S)-butanediol dehydrogenase / diacetyl reductase